MTPAGSHNAYLPFQPRLLPSIQLFSTRTIYPPCLKALLLSISSFSRVLTVSEKKSATDESCVVDSKHLTPALVLFPRHALEEPDDNEPGGGSRVAMARPTACLSPEWWHRVGSPIFCWYTFWQYIYRSISSSTGSCSMTNHIGRGRHDDARSGLGVTWQLP